LNFPYGTPLLAHDLRREDAESIKGRMRGGAPNAAVVWTISEVDGPIALLDRRAAAPAVMPATVSVAVSGA
jgi:hypothetical protein